MSSIRSVASSIPCNRAIRSSDHAEVTTTPRASRIRRLRSRIRMIRSFALSKSCLHGSTKGKSTLQAHPGFLSLHRSRSFSMQLLLAGPSGNLCRSSHKPMPVFNDERPADIGSRAASGDCRGHGPSPCVLEGYCPGRALRIRGDERVCSQSTHMAAALYVTQSSAPKKSAPTDRGAFHKLCWRLLGLLPLFGSSLLVSLLHLLRHYDLLLSFVAQNSLGGTAVNLQSHP